MANDPLPSRFRGWGARAQRLPHLVISGGVPFCDLLGAFGWGPENHAKDWVRIPHSRSHSTCGYPLPPDNPHTFRLQPSSRKSLCSRSLHHISDYRRLLTISRTSAKSKKTYLSLRSDTETKYRTVESDARFALGGRRINPFGSCVAVLRPIPSRSWPVNTLCSHLAALLAERNIPKTPHFVVTPASEHKDLFNGYVCWGV